MTEREVGVYEKVSSFEDLEVFQRAYRISLELHRISLKFPKTEQRVLADQIRRASKSICGNPAEGWGRRSSVAEFKRYVRIALGSSDEMRVWLRYCLDLKYIGHEQWQEWRNEYQTISRMLQGLQRNWR